MSGNLGGQGISCLRCNRNVSYRIHKNLGLNSILKQLNVVSSLIHLRFIWKKLGDLPDEQTASYV